MSNLLSIIGRFGVTAALAVCVALPGVAWAKDDHEKSNPGNPFAKILEAIWGVTQNWDKNLPSDTRFTVLKEFNNEAVRDDNTGLVWEQAPDAMPRNWLSARMHCATRTMGGVVGWRLPSVIELKSIQDLSLDMPYVPEDVFSNVQSVYWSATSDASRPDVYAWLVTFLEGPGGTVGLGFGNKDDSVLFHVWCVRGPMQEAAY